MTCSDFRLWLQADIQPPKIDFRLTPNNGHSEAHAGLPLLTRSGLKSDRFDCRDLRLPQCSMDESRHAKELAGLTFCVCFGPLMRTYNLTKS